MSLTIKDLKIGMTCTIKSVKQDKKHEGKVIIQKIGKDEIYTSVIKIGDQAVSLAGVSNFLIIEDAGKTPEVFQYVNPIVVKEGGKTYYKIKLGKSGSAKFNRRKKQRFPMGIAINVRADTNVRTYLCTLKDISATGFALVFKGENIPKNFDKIKTFHFTYNDFDPKYAFRATLSLTGVVKRYVYLDDKQMLFGCQISESAQVERYIQDKIKMQKGK